MNPLQIITTFAYSAVIVLVMAPAAYAECFTLTATHVMQERIFELVFGGTVVTVTRTVPAGYRATFEVDAMWKGTVPRRFDLWVSELAPEVPHFALGQRYIALAQRMTSTLTRQGAGVNDTDRDVYTR